MSKTVIKTVELTGGEMKIEGLSGQNTVIINNGNSTLYASTSPDIAAGADNVIEIPAGARDGLNDTHGTVYLLGSGRVELRGTDYAVNFRQPSSSASSGGGGITRGVICGTASEHPYPPEDIKSVLIEPGTEDKEKAFAAALAKETGWELQPDGVGVVKDGEVGFRFAGGGMNYIWLINNVRSSLDNLQYLERTGSQYYMDIFRSSSGAVAFGFRRVDDDPNIAFVMTKDSTGNNVCMTAYSGRNKLIWAQKEDDSVRALTITARTNVAGANNVMGLFACVEIYAGGTIDDCYCVHSTSLASSNTFFPPGTRISVAGKEFVIVCNRMYSITEQVWIAMAIN